MAVTVTDLAIRALKKSGNLGAQETANAADLQLAKEKIKATHQAVKIEGLLRWTLSNVPAYAEEPYVMMTAFLLQPEFQQPQDPSLWSMGLRQIQRGVNLPSVGTTQAEYF